MGIEQTYLHKGRELNLYGYQDPGGVDPDQVPVRSGAKAPGAGEFEFDVLGVAWQQDVLALSTKVKCHNLAYLYAELLIKDPQRDVYYGPVSREYIRAQDNESSSGITRPVWGDEVEVNARLRPLLRLLTNGAEFSLCCPLPEGYSSPGFRQGGLYTLAGDAEPLRALLGFSGEGALRRAIAYRRHERRTGARARAGARVLTPSQDDSFAPFIQAFTASKAGGWDINTALGDTLTMGSWPLRMVTDTALPGEYLAGVIAQDLDGGTERKYVPVRLGG